MTAWGQGRGAAASCSRDALPGMGLLWDQSPGPDSGARGCFCLDRTGTVLLPPAK